MTVKLAYPDTKRENIADELFGLPVADPYRWLETDVRDSDRVRAWVEAENAVTDAYLDTLPGRAAFTARMRTLFDYERFGVPVKKGGRYFRSEEHTSELQSLMRISYAVLCLKKKKDK